MFSCRSPVISIKWNYNARTNYLTGKQHEDKAHDFQQVFNLTNVQFTVHMNPVTTHYLLLT